MSVIGPALTPDEVKTRAADTVKGDGLKTPLPGVAADAFQMGKDAYKTNRDLVSKIQQLVHQLKPKDGNVPRFVWAFRMYPNAESKYWKQARDDHKCGCSCGGGCSCGNSNPPAPARKRVAKKRSAPLQRRK